jgi:hypothetical protein
VSELSSIKIIYERIGLVKETLPLFIAGKGSQTTLSLQLKRWIKRKYLKPKIKEAIIFYLMR